MREKNDKQIHDLSGEWKHTLMTHCLTNLKEENEEKEKNSLSATSFYKDKQSRSPYANLILIIV